MQSDEFEWDDAKAETNFRKHKVRFEHAAEACEDPFALIELEDSQDYGEGSLRSDRSCGRWRAQRNLHGTQWAFPHHFGS
jgi:uncharacterized DUF497 family protein